MPLNYSEILDALSEFTSRQNIDLVALATGGEFISRYPPIQKYILDLKNLVKPETAAEDLFSALCKDILDLQPARQVNSGEGWVDFMLPEKLGSPLPLELKPLFQRDGPTALWRSDANPKHHTVQVKKYLREHEYLILTDLRTAWFFSARDFFFEDKPFGQMPFVEFLRRSRDSRSILDTLRRAEDTADKPELARQFFEDLKIWFYEFDTVKWSPPEQSAESIILLINKLIFARTIEDYGLVPYRFTQDEYQRQTQRWEAKGAHRIVPKFLENFEDFFDEYYDTEIFSARVWERLDQSPANLQRFSEKLNFVLGINAWDKVFSRGIVHYNYRRIDEDIFGKSYEMFLAANRKDEGIYYTPASITGPMADSMVNSLGGKIVDEICEAVSSQKCDFQRAATLIEQLSELRVADTACGSGGFLIKVLRAFWQLYLRVDTALAWVRKITNPGTGELFLAELPPNVEAALAFRRIQNFDNRRILIAQILLRHIFGADKDPGAIEVAKTNIWKEAVKLSPGDYNYRLLKTDIVKILPNLELNFHSADSLVDVDLAKQSAWLAEYHQPELRKLSELRARYVQNPMDHAPLEESLQLRERLRQHLIEQFQSDNLPATPGAFALHFWPCWFNPNGSPRQAPGFDGIVGNPPWEGFKPFRKEFASSVYAGKQQFRKMGMDGPAFEKWFEDELKNNAAFAARWREHENHYERHKEYFSRAYHKQGTGDWNLFKLFIERDLALVRQGGQFSLLVPSSFQTDEGCSDIRRWFITEHRLEELTVFENKGWREIDEFGKEKRKKIFPDVHPQFKFGFFKLLKGGPTPEGHAFEGRFYLHNPKDVFQPCIRYSREMVAAFSPENLAFMEFRSATDYSLAAKIRGNHRLLRELDYRFQRELHMTDDNHLFIKLNGKKPQQGQLPLYEGKLIHQYDSGFMPVALVVDESTVRAGLVRKEIYRLNQFVREHPLSKLGGKNSAVERDEFEQLAAKQFESGKFKLQYEFERLGIRDIGSSTNERTIIATVVPSRVCIGNTINFLRPFRYGADRKGNIEQQVLPPEEIKGLLCLFNSLALNYYIRSKVSAHVNIHQLLELPICVLLEPQKMRLCTSADKLLRDPCNVNERAALEVFIARDLYKLGLEDWKHLTGTFTYGGGDSKAELDEIVRLSLAMWSK